MSDSIFDITPPPTDGETPWFKGGEAPGQPGVYKRIYYTADGWTFPSYCWWDGEKWFTGADKPEKAQDNPMIASHYQPFYRDGFDFAWCGLMPVDELEALSEAKEARFDLLAELSKVDTTKKMHILLDPADFDRLKEIVEEKLQREEQLDLPLEEPDDNAAFFEV